MCGWEKSMALYLLSTYAVAKYLSMFVGAAVLVLGKSTKREKEQKRRKKKKGKKKKKSCAPCGLFGFSLNQGTRIR